MVFLITDTGVILQQLKVFDDYVCEIITLAETPEWFICYSPSDAVIMARNVQFEVKTHLFKVAAIKSVYKNLSIKQIASHISAGKLAIAVLLNDDSLWIYEGTVADGDTSIALSKHIHPIEQRDLHCRQLFHGDANNNSKCILAETIFLWLIYWCHLLERWQNEHM